MLIYDVSLKRRGRQERKEKEEETAGVEDDATKSIKESMRKR